MANPPILASRQLRLAAIAALQAASLDAQIESPGDWQTPSERLPMILLRMARERKESTSKGMPTFTTTSVMELSARLEATSEIAAQDAIEALGARIEQALLTNYSLISLVQQVAFIERSIEVTATGRHHVGEFKMAVGFEVFEAFDVLDVSPPEALTEIGVHVDLAAPFDANGTYANPPFPDAVSPAPRTSGPDGRDEGYLDIQFPQ